MKAVAGARGDAGEEKEVLLGTLSTEVMVGDEDAAGVLRIALSAVLLSVVLLGSTMDDGVEAVLVVLGAAVGSTVDPFCGTAATVKMSVEEVSVTVAVILFTVDPLSVAAAIEKTGDEREGLGVGARALLAVVTSFVEAVELVWPMREEIGTRVTAELLVE